MTTMRAVLAAALASLALVAAGCGSANSQVARASDVQGDAAGLVPSDARAFAAVDTEFDSQQWQRIDTLTKSFPARAKLVEKLLHGLDWRTDVAPALGPELDVAALGKRELVAFTKSRDEAKLRAVAAKLSEGNEQYSVQQIGGWSVVADSQAAFARIRAAANRKSLRDTPAFQSAWRAVSGDGVVQLYIRGSGWFAARVSADADALRIDGVARPRHALRSLAARSLLGDVPSGAALAVAFRGTGDLLSRLAATKLPVKQLAALLSGGGVLYARPASFLPDVALELAPKDPQAALVSARALLRSLAPNLGPLQLTAQLSDGKLVIADSPSAAAALRSGHKLVDDAAFKDALAKADVPAEPAFLAYADVSQLAPFVPVLIQAVSGHAPDPSLGDNLSHIGPVLAWGTRDNGLVRVHAWLTTR
jgi:hypothetical protein